MKCPVYLEEWIWGRESERWGCWGSSFINMFCTLYISPCFLFKNQYETLWGKKVDSRGDHFRGELRLLFGESGAEGVALSDPVRLHRPEDRETITLGVTCCINRCFLAVTCLKREPLCYLSVSFTRGLLWKLRFKRADLWFHHIRQSVLVYQTLSQTS